MNETIFSTYLILIFSALFGITMKIADLFNEHGLKSWFKGSAIIFGILWGIFGALLVSSDIYVANLILAIILAFVFRMRIDYKNHAIATVIIIIAFIFYNKLEPTTFLLFFINFVTFGSLKDYFDDTLKSKGFLYKLFETGWYYFIPTLIYSIITSRWLVFLVSTTYVLFYDMIKYSMEKRPGEK